MQGHNCKNTSLRGFKTSPEINKLLKSDYNGKSFVIYLISNKEKIEK